MLRALRIYTAQLDTRSPPASHVDSFWTTLRDSAAVLTSATNDCVTLLILVIINGDRKLPLAPFDYHITHVSPG